MCNFKHMHQCTQHVHKNKQRACHVHTAHSIPTNTHIGCPQESCFVVCIQNLKHYCSVSLCVCVCVCVSVCACVCVSVCVSVRVQTRTRMRTQLAPMDGRTATFRSCVRSLYELRPVLLNVLVCMNERNVNYNPRSRANLVS